MKKSEVPQEAGPEAELKRVMYAVDENEKFTLVQSLGWEPSNEGFNRYWEFINQTITEARQKVERGEASPLYYYMIANVMTEGSLASYMGMFKWRVRRHMRPEVFKKLKPELLQRYAKIFRVSAGELNSLPPGKPAEK